MHNVRLLFDSRTNFTDFIRKCSIVADTHKINGPYYFKFEKIQTHGNISSMIENVSRIEESCKLANDQTWDM